MQLKGKIITVLVSALVFITLAYYAVFRVIVLQGFVDLEKMDAERNMQRCVATLDREMLLLNRFVHDWSAWDDTFAFVRDRNPAYVKANLTQDVLRDQNLSLIHLYDSEGRLAAGIARDPKTGRAITFDLAGEVGPAVFWALVDQKRVGRATTGIVQTSHGPMMISSNPILTSDVTGPSRGALMMGRPIDGQVARQISEQVEVGLTILKPGENAHGQIGSRPPSGSRNRISIVEEGSETISAYATLTDLAGTPALTLHADMPRNIMKRGMKAYLSGYLFIICVGTLLLLLMGRLVQFLVLDPVSRLNESVNAVAEGAKDLEVGLTRRKDELGTLSKAFASMLGKLKDREQRLSDIISFLPDATFAVDAQGRVIAWNRAMEDLTGVAREHITGRGGRIYAIPFYGERRPMLLDLILEPGGDMSRQYDFIHAEGDTLMVEAFAPRLFGGKGAYLWAVAAKLYDSSGNVSGSIECIRDITLRKKGEELLMHQKAIIEQSLDGIVMADLNGAILYANPSAAGMFGREPAELVGRNMRALHTEEQLRAGVAPLVEGVKALGRSTGKVGHVRKDGSAFTALVTLFLLKDHKGDAVAIIAIIRDISEELRMESRLRHSQKMDVIGQLAGGVAHDLNNLLSPILGYTEMILQGMPDGDPYRHGLHQVLVAADRARKLTRQLLAFGSKQVLEMKTIDLAEVVESYTGMMRRSIREDIEIRITAGESLPGVLADADQVGQVLMNLTLNARDAMPAGGVISIDVSEAFLDEGYAAAHQGVAPGTYLILSVSDTGTGMDRETVEHIFEPFFTTKERGKGTGLGLATVYGIVSQHRGHVLVFSEPGAGTTFRICLPASGDAAERLPDKAEPGSCRRGSETVAVAEDDEGVRKLTCEILEGNGYRVISAASLEEFLALVEAEKGPIDLMVTDVIMPGLNGKQLFERLRAGRPGMKALFMSGYTDDVIANHGILDQGVHFIQKPYSIQGFTEKVRQVIDG